MSVNLSFTQLQNIERHFESESLFLTCSVATNLVTSLQINLIRCATMLCHFGQKWIGSVATHFFLLSSTATSSATEDYVVIPERFVQNEEPASRNK